MRTVKDAFEHELGGKAKDIITGFEGTITGAVRYLTGCDQYLVTPSVDKEGKKVESQWFDSNRVEVIKEKVVKLKKEKYTGPCMQAPIKG